MIIKLRFDDCRIGYRIGIIDLIHQPRHNGITKYGMSWSRHEYTKFYIQTQIEAARCFDGLDAYRTVIMTSISPCRQINYIAFVDICISENKQS